MLLFNTQGLVVFKVLSFDPQFCLAKSIGKILVYIFFSHNKIFLDSLMSHMDVFRKLSGSRRIEMSIRSRLALTTLFLHGQTQEDFRLLVYRGKTTIINWPALALHSNLHSLWQQFLKTHHFVFFTVYQQQRFESC
jgi:hypothetical protein